MYIRICIYMYICIYIKCVCVFAPGSTHVHSINVEIQRQLVGVVSLLLPCGSLDKTEVIRPGSKRLYLQSHFTGSYA